MNTIFTELQPTTDTPCTTKLISYIESHGHNAALLPDGNLGVDDNYLGEVIPASVRAVRAWLGY